MRGLFQPVKRMGGGGGEHMLQREGEGDGARTMEKPALRAATLERGMTLGVMKDVAASVATTASMTKGKRN